MDRIPVTLLTGFLGSGKTTVLNRLVQQSEMVDTLVLINEFGEVGLDHLLVTHSREDIIMEMSSGCLCCTIRGDLVRTLKEILDAVEKHEQRRFGRVVIETSGLADPVPIVHTLASHAELKDRYRFDGVVTTIDARNGEATFDAHIEAVKQAAMADKLLVTKTDLVPPDALMRLNRRLRTINPAAEMMYVGNGELAAQRILDLGLFTTDGKISDVQRWLAEEHYRDRDSEHHHHAHELGHEEHPSHDHGDQQHRHHHDHRDVNRHDDQIRAFCFTVDEPIPQAVLTEWLDVLLSLMGPSMLRIKGILNIKGVDQPVVIHGVQHVFHPPVMLDGWPSDDRRSKIVFITRSIGRETIVQSFQIFSEAGGIRSQRDHSAYFL